MSQLVVLSKENDMSFASEARPPLDLASSCCVLDCNLVPWSRRHVCALVRGCACVCDHLLKHTKSTSSWTMTFWLFEMKPWQQWCSCCAMLWCAHTHTHRPRPSVRYQCHTYKHPPHHHHTTPHTFSAPLG